MIYSLIEDIYFLFKESSGLTPETISSISETTAQRIGSQFLDREPRRTLRLSNMGSQCPCKLWYSVHHPEMAEQLPPWATIKYTYGHILEAMVISLAKASGHTVTGEQDEIVLDGIRGHRDCIIDGCIVDVKSSASRSFLKFRDGSIAQDDSFGYLDQLDGYICASAEDPLVTVKDRGYLLAIDKTLGHMCLYEHKLREDSIRNRIKEYKEIAARTEPPTCTCGTVADGKSGNIKLDTIASYNGYKYCCKPGLRTFIYSSGPVYLTHVARKPDVMEVDKHGKVVYN